MVDILLWAGVFMYLSSVLLNAPSLVKKVRLTHGSLIWLALAWILAFWGLAVFDVRSNVVVSINNLDSSATYQLVLFGLAILILFGLAIRRSIFHNIFRTPVLMMATYGILGVVSAVYSPAPAFSAYKGALILMDVLLVLVALSYITFADLKYRRVLLNLSYFLLSLMVFGAALGGVLVPEITRHAITGIFGYQLYGKWPFLNPNELGFLSAIVGIVALRRFFEKTPLMEKYFWFTQFYLSTVVLIIAQARTSVLSFALSVFVLSILIRKMRWMGSVTFILIMGTSTYGVLTSGSVGWVEVVEKYSKRGLSENQLTTLTGRTELWERGIDMFLESPAVGHGYDAGVKMLGRYYGIGVGHLHNAHLQLLANSGIAGYLAWFIMVATVTWKVFNLLFQARWPLSEEANRFSAETMAVLIIIILRTFTGQVLVTHQYSFLLFMAILVFVNIEGRVATNSLNNLTLNSRTVSSRSE